MFGVTPFKFQKYGNGGRSGKMQLAAFDGPSPKTPPMGAKISRKTLTEAKL